MFRHCNEIIDVLGQTVYTTSTNAMNTTIDLSSFDKGIAFSSKYFLEIAIIFLGFGIRFQDIANLGSQLVVILILTITIVLFATIYLAKIFT